MPDIEDTKKYVKKVAEHRKWVLQPDETMFNDLIEGIAINKERYGYRSCPCRLATGEKEKDRDIICPCQYAEPDIKEFGHCYCALYLTKEFVEKDETPRKIPERRLMK
ncbi:MAG: ferredoxin-thioredoxin reductase catalytic domain-containing protein [Candidatus Hodarchaeota archaeon]